MPAAVRALGEVALRVNDLEQMQAFYLNIIGLELMCRFEHAAFFRIAEGYEGHTSVLALFDRNVLVRQERSTLDHLAFAIARDDYEPQKQRLEALGLSVTTATHDWVHWRSIYVRDPEGNTVELVCYDPNVQSQYLSSARRGLTKQTIMNSQQLIRSGGLAAILAGALRTAASFWPSAEPRVTLEILYLVIDILILFGIFGIYAYQHERVGWFGFVGFLLAVTGTAIIAGPDGTIGSVNMYAAGSLFVGAGIVLLAVGSWTARTLPRWVAILWIVSTLVGILGAVTGRERLFVVTGVTFGLAFVGAGARLWSRLPG